MKYSNAIRPCLRRTIREYALSVASASYVSTEFTDPCYLLLRWTCISRPTNELQTFTHFKRKTTRSHRKKQINIIASYSDVLDFFPNLVELSDNTQFENGNQKRNRQSSVFLAHTIVGRTEELCIFFRRPSISVFLKLFGIAEHQKIIFF